VAAQGHAACLIEVGEGLFQAFAREPQQAQATNPRNSRKANESAARHAIARSASKRSK
jgi:hypothetical protein